MRKRVYFVTIAVLPLVAIAFSVARAQIKIAHQPASQGRPISPAGSLVMDATTGYPAVGSLPVKFVRSPDHSAKDGGGRFLVAVNSGFGVEFDASNYSGAQSLSVIDLNAQPAPKTIQNVYFPAPQSANVGAVFSPRPLRDGSYLLYVPGGYENKIWVFRFNPKSRQPIFPPSPGPNTKVNASFISVAALSSQAGSLRYQHGVEPVYPTGLAISPDGNTLFVANDLGDSLGIIRDLRYERRLTRIDLSDGQAGHFVYPYEVAVYAPSGAREAQKAYVSCWATASLAVIDLERENVPVKFVRVGPHPTEMIFNAARTRLYVVNSDGDSVSVIDTSSDRVVETISVRLAEKALPGGSPEGLALNADGETLYVANAHSNAVAVVSLSPEAIGRSTTAEHERDAAANHDSDSDDPAPANRSSVRGFIPTGQYPSAIAVANENLIVGNGKGTGFQNSSMIVDNSGRAPNGPSSAFPVGRGHKGAGGEYDVALIAGNYSLIPEPDPPTLANYTNEVLQNDGLVGRKDVQLFAGKSPIHHIIYIIRENRTYDQVFGDITKAGDGTPADGDPSLAIFGGGEAAERPNGEPQNITPNAHALALRFGLFDRFFVNSEASPDGHNWCNAAFSTDYVDKAFRWNYSDRGRTYDFEGENRMPEIMAMRGEAPILPLPATPEQIADYVKRFIPYLHGARDVGEPSTLYLWDDAARMGITYRTFGEFMGTISQDEVAAFNANRERDYPDTSETAITFPAKKALEGHASPTFRAFDLYTPDSMTTESYQAAKKSGADALISSWNSDPRFRGYSRIASFLTEFRGYVRDLKDGRGETLPAFSVMHLPNDHTNGMSPRMPTPQFYAAENDYALGLLVQEVSGSPYWKDTAIFVLEDDSQDGPDHVDAHRSPALVISAYNRPGALIHQYHSTVSLIRTMELLLGMPPMNQLDASASPMDVFQSQPDLRPYKAMLPEVAPNNLLNRPSFDRETARYIRQSEEQNFTSEDLANPQILNRIIWFSARGDRDPYPAIAQLPAFDVMRTRAIQESAEEVDLNRLMKTMLARKVERKSPKRAD